MTKSAEAGAVIPRLKSSYRLFSTALLPHLGRLAVILHLAQSLDAGGGLGPHMCRV